MRKLIASTALALTFVAGGATAWHAQAAVFMKGSAPDVTSQAGQVRCDRNAPGDGCGLGWYRGRNGQCRPC